LDFGNYGWEEGEVLDKPRKIIDNLADALALEVDKDRVLHSATHEEILQGISNDIYFVKTIELLRQFGKADTTVVAEIFPSRDGVLAGMDETLNVLKNHDLSVFALSEGERFSKKEVIMRIEGPYSEFGYLETIMLGMLASASGWATRAREVREVAKDLPTICFGSRHLHPAVAPVMERAALVGGMTGASNILGAKLGGTQPRGTIPHALVIIAGDTVEVAKAYDESMPESESRIILVDTFKDEAEESLRVANELKEKLQAVRLDTPGERGGVTVGLVREVKARLEQAGYGHVGIFVSGGVTPERMVELIEAGATGFGVGSYISAAPPIDMTMDIKMIDGKPMAKRGRIPGITINDRLKKVI